MGAPNWKLGLPMLPTVELSVYEHVIANLIDEVRSLSSLVARSEQCLSRRLQTEMA